MQLEEIAAICHEANRRHCINLGDHSQPKWNMAPQEQRDSYVRGVKFRLANLSAPVSANHENWMSEKLADGWTHGEKKDVAAKKHPCLVPFEQLPHDQQAKDYLFTFIVLGLSPFATEGA